jgi:acyl-CoA synthetase (AMP-forming)/AMP-acid ligase II
VLEAAVIGVPDEKWGEVVVAYVQPRPGSTIDPSALQSLCARSLTGFKRPTAFFVVEAIAKNAVGKIDKVSLRAAHTEVSART